MSEVHAQPGEATAEDEPAASPRPRRAAGHPIEIILARQLAGYLDLAIIIIDPAWSVIYYNESAEHILGRSFDEAGPIPWTAWSNAFHFTDTAGRTIRTEALPLLESLQSRRISHLEFGMRGLDGIARHVAAVGVPLLGDSGRFLGAIAFLQVLES